jgi:biopolymer transport protein ExbD
MGADVGTKGSVKSEPNVVPMIDIMLVLLIIFMIVTPVVTQGGQMKIPQGKNIESADEVEGDVILGIDRDGVFYLDPGSKVVSQVSAERLEGALKQIYDARTVDKKMYFRADANLDYGKIEDALQIARRAGVRVLATITEQKRENPLEARRGGD